MKNFIFLLFFFEAPLFPLPYLYDYLMTQTINNSTELKKDETKIEEQYYNMLVDYPDNSELLYNTAVLLSKKEKYAEALSLFLRAGQKHTEKDKKNLKEFAYYNAAGQAYNLGDTDKAIHLYEETLSINPENEYAKHNLAILKAKKESDSDKSTPDKQQNNNQNNKQDNQNSDNSNKSDNNQKQNNSENQNKDKQNNKSDPQDNNQQDHDQQSQHDNQSSDTNAPQDKQNNQQNSEQNSSSDHDEKTNEQDKSSQSNEHQNQDKKKNDELNKEQKENPEDFEKENPQIKIIKT